MPASVTTADEVGAAGTEEPVLRSVEDPMTDASKTATEHSAKVTQAVSDAGPLTLRSVSRYAVVYPVVFGVRLAAAAERGHEGLP